MLCLYSHKNLLTYLNLLSLKKSKFFFIRKNTHIGKTSTINQPEAKIGLLIMGLGGLSLITEKSIRINTNNITPEKNNNNKLYSGLFNNTPFKKTTFTKKPIAGGIPAMLQMPPPILAFWLYIVLLKFNPVSE